MGDDFTKAALADKTDAALKGAAEGRRLIEALQRTPEYLAMAKFEPYLLHLYLVNAAQIIANHGREIAGIGGRSAYEPQKKGAKA
jgi:hypothetical protein